MGITPHNERGNSGVGCFIMLLSHYFKLLNKLCFGYNIVLFIFQAHFPVETTTTTKKHAHGLNDKLTKYLSSMVASK